MKSRTKVGAVTPNHRVLDLDQKCDACKCGSNADRTAILKSFKMACLAYKPSFVKMRNMPEVCRLKGHLLPRPEVISIQDTISDNLRHL